MKRLNAAPVTARSSWTFRAESLAPKLADTDFRQNFANRGLRATSARLNYRPTLGCSQAVRQRFLVPCTVGSNPTTPATFHKNHMNVKAGLGISASRLHGPEIFHHRPHHTIRSDGLGGPTNHGCCHALPAVAHLGRDPNPFFMLSLQNQILLDAAPLIVAKEMGSSDPDELTLDLIAAPTSSSASPSLFHAWRVVAIPVRAIQSFSTQRPVQKRGCRH